MKKLSLLLALAFMAVGCANNLESKDTGYSIGGVSFKIVIIDNCQYLYYSGGNASMLTHKGNCNNPIHKIK